MVKSRNVLLTNSVCALLAVFAVPAAGWAGSAEAAPSKCFGKKINKVVKGNNKKVKLGFKDVAWIAGDKVTTGSGGKKNKVISDRKDKVVYGWGGARF